MRALAITGMDTVLMIPSIRSGSLMRATPPCARMSAGTRSSAITATAPAASAIFACSAVTTSMITPPLSISAMPRLTRPVPVTGLLCSATVLPLVLRTATRVKATQPGGPLRQPIGARWPAPPFSVAGHRGGPGQHRVVHVEVARLRVPAGQPQQPDQPTTAHAEGVPDQVAVHLAAQRDPTAGGHHGLVGGLGRRRYRGGQFAQRAGEVVLHRRPVLGRAVGRGADQGCVRRPAQRGGTG